MGEYAVATLILMNAVIIGVESDRQLKNVGILTTADEFTNYLQDICMVIFAFELLLRILAYRLRLFTREDANWNIFDICCVSFGLVEILSESFSNQGSLARTMRIPRVLRVLRVFRVSRFFRDIRLMMYMIYCSFQSLFWMLFLLILLVYIVGVALARFIVAYMQEVNATDVESVGIKGIENFMGVSHCMFSLLKGAFGGNDWGPYFDTLRSVGTEAGFLFMAYIAIMLLAILNVITGVFVDNTMATVRDDRDLTIAHQLDDEASAVQNLKHLFRSVIEEEQDRDLQAGDDTPNTQMMLSDITFTEREFYKIIVHDRVRAYFAILGLELTHAEGLFKLLDTDRSGRIGLEEFVLGCLRLKGEAKAVDVATLMYENKRLLQKSREQQSREMRQFYDAIHQDCLQMLEQQSREIRMLEQHAAPVPASDRQKPDLGHGVEDSHNAHYESLPLEYTERTHEVI